MSYNVFKADEWGGLGVTERVARCHIMNNEALALADTASPKQTEAYRDLARAWMKVADAIASEEICE